jgi:hypothetical protein
VTYRLELSEGKLKLTIGRASGAFSGFENGQPEYLRPTGTDEFLIGNTGITIHFRRDAEHMVSSFLLNAGRTRGMVFGRSIPGKL